MRVLCVFEALFEGLFALVFSLCSIFSILDPRSSFKETEWWLADNDGAEDEGIFCDANWYAWQGEPSSFFFFVFLNFLSFVCESDVFSCSLFAGCVLSFLLDVTCLPSFQIHIIVNNPFHRILRLNNFILISF